VNSPLLRGVAAAMALVGATTLLVVVVLALAGHEPGPALAALWRGAFGSWYALTSATLVRATPLLLAGLAVAVAFRAGVLNIGAEGQLIAGAVVATAIALAFPQLGWVLLPLGIAGGAGGGVAWALIPAVLKRRYGVLEVISTLMLNIVALHLVSWIVRGPLQEPSHAYPQTTAITDAARLPLVVPGTRLHAGFLLAIGGVVVASWVLSKTAAGFRLRAVGANARAAQSAGGIVVARVVTGAFLVSGAIAGVAGAVEVQGVTFALYESISPGYGYTAIAVALLARLEPRWLVPSAILFAALEAGASAMQRDAGIPSVMVKVVEALLILGVLAAEAFRQRQHGRAAAAA
jgi:simple sugar transport system permease protein